MHSDSAGELIAKRIRNRVIEYFELASSLEEQRLYQLRVPGVWVPHEVVNQWEDWVDPERLDAFDASVFSPEELDAMRVYQLVWSETCDALPDPLPPLAVLAVTREWEHMRDAAQRALLVFRRRGKQPEDNA